jgi:hypothetical protein
MKGDEQEHERIGRRQFALVGDRLILAAGGPVKYATATHVGDECRDGRNMPGVFWPPSEAKGIPSRAPMTDEVAVHATARNDTEPQAVQVSLPGPGG